MHRLAQTIWWTAMTVKMLFLGTLILVTVPVWVPAIALEKTWEWAKLETEK